MMLKRRLSIILTSLFIACLFLCSTIAYADVAPPHNADVTVQWSEISYGPPAYGFKTVSEETLTDMTKLHVYLYGAEWLNVSNSVGYGGTETNLYINNTKVSVIYAIAFNNTAAANSTAVMDGIDIYASSTLVKSMIPSGYAINITFTTTAGSWDYIYFTQPVVMVSESGSYVTENWTPAKINYPWGTSGIRIEISTPVALGSGKAGTYWKVLVAHRITASWWTEWQDKDIYSYSSTSGQVIINSAAETAQIVYKYTCPDVDPPTGTNLTHVYAVAVIPKLFTSANTEYSYSPAPGVTETEYIGKIIERIPSVDSYHDALLITGLKNITGYTGNVVDLTLYSPTITVYRPVVPLNVTTTSSITFGPISLPNNTEEIPLYCAVADGNHTYTFTNGLGYTVQAAETLNAINDRITFTPPKEGNYTLVVAYKTYIKDSQGDGYPIFPIFVYHIHAIQKSFAGGATGGGGAGGAPAILTTPTPKVVIVNQHNNPPPLPHNLVYITLAVAGIVGVAIAVGVIAHVGSRRLQRWRRK